MYIDFNDIIYNIANGEYRYIGSGSSRTVFDMRNGFVIKVAKNIKGIAQNKVEYEISNDDYTNLFANVYYASENYKYLIMEKAIPIKREIEFLRYFGINNRKELASIEEIKDIQYRYNLVFADLYKLTSWGKVKGRIVLIDYGYTKEIYDKYYKNRKR